MVDSHTDNGGRSSTHKQRGPSSLKSLIHRHKETGTKEPVMLEGDGTIAGKVSTSFTTYLGIVVRSRVPITYGTWKSVPDEQRDMALFDVPQTELIRKFKAREMRAAARMWRNFKSELANQYIFGPKQGEDPTIMYPFIGPEQWKSFVKQPSTPEAQEIRAKNINRAKSNQYQHTLSRGGYKKAKAELLTEKKTQMEEQGLISPGEEPVIHIERHEVWKKGHQWRNKEYVNDSMRMVAEKIDELQDLASQGRFTSRGRRDILTEVTGKYEYPGRTRGVGSLVCGIDVFAILRDPFFKLQCSSFEDEDMSRMSMACRFLYEHACGMDKSTLYSVYISSEVFGEDCFVDLNNDCIKEFTTFQVVGASSVEVYIR
ncbi:hypothetical protein QQ045_022712 [Rhodiola kirilowii]